ncbi:MAG: pilus assembly protein PilM [Candidatus Nomurabacteria bacterium]|nr:pilus assembly protein PilM [Candidatus Nomurabacteria bacterium]
MATFLKKYFPPPELMLMPAIGLDISDSSIKYAEIVHSHKKNVLKQFGKKSLPQNAITQGAITSKFEVEKVLHEIQALTKRDFVRVALPEDQIHLFDLRIPKVSSKEIEQAIFFQIEEHIPIPKNNLVFDYNLIAEEKNVYHIQVHAIMASVVDQYLEVITKAGFAVLSFELGPQAMTRTLFDQNSHNQSVLVDIGAVHTTISVVYDNNVIFASNVGFGGNILTQEIANISGKSTEEAEQLKQKQGLGSDSEYISVLEQHVNQLAMDIVKHQQYCVDHRGFPAGEHQIVLIGGGAYLPGLAEYLGGQLGLSVNRGRFFDGNLQKINFGEDTLEQPLTYVTAIGLALAQFDHD